MKVTHPKFGQGQVIKQDEKTVAVDFNGTVKVLDAKFSKLSNEDGTPFGEQFVPQPKKAKKLNRANFMREEEFAKSKYSKMSKGELEAEMREVAMKTKSW